MLKLFSDVILSGLTFVGDTELSPNIPVFFYEHGRFDFIVSSGQVRKDMEWSLRLRFSLRKSMTSRSWK